jgi:hypothetical protein
MELKYFMHRIKRANGTFDKGIEVHDTLESAKQSYHAYLGAYSYGHDQNTDYVQCAITEMNGGTIMVETWIKPEPEPEPEE